MSSLLPLWVGVFSLFALHYSLTSSLLATGYISTIEVGPDDTFNDLEAKLSKEFKITGKLTCHSPGEARDVNKDRESQRVRDVFPNPALFHIRIIPDKQPVEAETPVGTERHNLSIHDNVVEDRGDMYNKILYPELHVTPVVATINGNRATGDGVQTNHIGDYGPIRGGSWIQNCDSTTLDYRRRFL